MVIHQRGLTNAEIKLRAARNALKATQIYFEEAPMAGIKARDEAQRRLLRLVNEVMVYTEPDRNTDLDEAPREMDT